MYPNRNITVPRREVLNLIFRRRQIFFVGGAVFFAQDINRLVVRAAQATIIVALFDIGRVNQHGDIFQNLRRQLVLHVAGVNENVVADFFYFLKQTGQVVGLKERVAARYREPVDSMSLRDFFCQRRDGLKRSFIAGLKFPEFGITAAVATTRATAKPNANAIARSQNFHGI